MALAALKIWASNEILTASDLNAEFANIRNNALSLISPLTANLDFGGFQAVALIPSAVAPATPVAHTIYRDSIVKGWVKFSVAGVIDEDLNVSSVTDNGAGDWTINWALAFSSAEYAIVCGLSGETARTPSLIPCIGLDPTTTVARFYTITSDAGLVGDPVQGGARMHAIAIGSQ